METIKKIESSFSIFHRLIGEEESCTSEPQVETNRAVDASDGQKTRRVNVELLVRSEESEGCMVLRIDKEGRIENPRDYSPRVVNELRTLLTQGIEGRPDRRREHFYELEGDQGTFYIHISPVSAKVILLAWWAHQPGTQPDARLVTSESRMA
jgi:hypothetical protein